MLQGEQIILKYYSAASAKPFLIVM